MFGNGLGAENGGINPNAQQNLLRQRHGQKGPTPKPTQNQTPKMPDPTATEQNGVFATAAKAAKAPTEQTSGTGLGREVLVERRIHDRSNNRKDTAKAALRNMGIAVAMYSATRGLLQQGLQTKPPTTTHVHHEYIGKRFNPENGKLEPHQSETPWNDGPTLVRNGLAFKEGMIGEKWTDYDNIRGITQFRGPMSVEQFAKQMSISETWISDMEKAFGPLDDFSISEDSRATDIKITTKKLADLNDPKFVKDKATFDTATMAVSVLLVVGAILATAAEAKVIEDLTPYDTLALPFVYNERATDFKSSSADSKMLFMSQQATRSQTLLAKDEARNDVLDYVNDPDPIPTPVLRTFLKAITGDFGQQDMEVLADHTPLATLVAALDLIGNQLVSNHVDRPHGQGTDFNSLQSSQSEQAREMAESMFTQPNRSLTQNILFMISTHAMGLMCAFDTDENPSSEKLTPFHVAETFRQLPLLTDRIARSANQTVGNQANFNDQAEDPRSV